MSLNKINQLDGTKFCTEMEIQHRKLINAKFWQYANHVSNAHEQHKMVWEGRQQPNFDGIFCKCMVLVILYLNQTGTMICLLFVMQISLSIIHNMLDLHDKEER